MPTLPRSAAAARRPSYTAAMTFDTGSPPPGWEHQPLPPPGPPGPYIAPNPYGWGDTARDHPNGTTILVLGIFAALATG